MGIEDRLHDCLEHAAHHLPAQAPLGLFVHHNTLHAFQAQPFHQAVASAARKLGARGWLDEDAYWAAYQCGRITDDDLAAALREWPLGIEPIPGLPPVERLAQVVLIQRIRGVTTAHLSWLVSEHDLACDPLWVACREATSAVSPPPEAPRAPPRFPREWLLRVGHEDPNDWVHPVLIPWCAAFLDHGQAHWSMPARELGFFTAWSRLVTSGRAVRHSWLSTLGQRLRGWETRGLNASAVVSELLNELGVAGEQLGPFVEHTLLQLPGWAGMFNRMARTPTGPTLRASITLLDFFAVRLVLDVLATRHVADRLGSAAPLVELAAFCARLPSLEPDTVRDLAWPLYRLAGAARLTPESIRALGPGPRSRLLDFLGSFDEHERLVRWQEAYERHYREQLLRALETAPRTHAPRRDSRKVQAIFCIDDRAESFRRHFEALSDGHETFGAPGFFNLAIAFQGIDDPATFPLCPVVVAPRHRIRERPVSEHRHLAAARARRLKRLGLASSLFARATRSFLWGPIITALSGFLATAPLLLRVFAPRLAEAIRRRAARGFLPDLRTELTLERAEDAEQDGGVFDGFSLDEKAERVATLLENIGLVKDFAPVVLLLGHDASSVNNPHFAAYSCGACGGRSGGPNARLFARMANRKEVRERLAARGIRIPDGTVFVGGVHDTTIDEVRLFEVDALMAAERLGELAELQAALNAALKNNAQERCRRFESAPGSLTASEAIDHVFSRSVDLSEPRPELGHASNASCVVGRRSLSRGTFLDRRAFLVSYDPTIDRKGHILQRILEAVGPVAAGINLEYFFSTTDNARLGAGTKLPHNVTGLFGVMDGAQSDLRTGLPKQMIEIHEPIRLQMVIETTPDIFEGVLARAPAIAELVGNAWVRVMLVDPETGRIRGR